MAHDVFVSYSSKDKNVADAVVSTLEGNDIRCWYAPRDVPPGEDWAEQIAAAISDASIFLLIFSESANKSQRVLDELNLAINKEVVILPFRIEKLNPIGAMQLHLSARHWLDAFDPSWKAHLDRLNTSVVAILEGSDKELSEHLKKSEKVIARRKKRKRLLIYSIISIVIVTLTAIILIPRLLPSSQKPTETVTLTEIVQEVKPSETPSPSPTITETPSSTPTQIGSVDNPLIIMYAPKEEFEFEQVNAAKENLVVSLNENEADLNIRMMPSASMEAIQTALCNGDAHVGILDAFTYLTITQAGCLVEAHLVWSAYEDIKFGGEIFVNDSREEFQTLDDLEGQKLCVPDFDTTSGWVLPSLEFRAAVGDPFTFFGEIVTLGSHNAVLEGVYNGDCDVGTAFYDVREFVPELPDVMERIRIIARTTFVPNTNITFSNEIDPSRVEQLKALFIALSSENSDLALISGIPEENAMKLIEINDYYYSELRNLFERAGENPEDYIWWK